MCPFFEHQGPQCPAILPAQEVGEEEDGRKKVEGKTKGESKFIEGLKRVKTKREQ